MTKTLLTSEQRKDAGLVKYEQDLQAAYALKAMYRQQVVIRILIGTVYVKVEGTLIPKMQAGSSTLVSKYLVSPNTGDKIAIVEFGLGDVTDVYVSAADINVIEIR